MKSIIAAAALCRCDCLTGLGSGSNVRACRLGKRSPDRGRATIRSAPLPSRVDSAISGRTSGIRRIACTILRGEYVGADPDPFIRNDLARDPPNRNDD